jgi:hypothetical protein
MNQLGLKSESWTFVQNHFGYAADKVLFKETDSLLLCELKRLWFLTYVFRFDVVFFNFGQTLFPQYPARFINRKSPFVVLVLPFYRVYADLMQRIELLLLRLLGRVLLVQYQGDDARQGDFSCSHFSIAIARQVGDGYYSAESDVLKRKQIRRLARACNKAYALNPDLLHVLPAKCEFLPYSHVSLDDWLPSFTQLETRPLRIGHAPSHRGVKGTALILDAIGLLKDQGYSFEFVLVEGLCNAEAMERYKTVDVMVDQLFAGWYGGLAVEVMALGKPVVAYIREDDMKFLPPGMVADLPIIRTTPDGIHSVLRSILEMSRTELYALAKRSRAYVERWHNPLVVAQRVKSDIEFALSEG